MKKQNCFTSNKKKIKTKDKKREKEDISRTTTDMELRKETNINLVTIRTEETNRDQTIQESNIKR